MFFSAIFCLSLACLSLGGSIAPYNAEAAAGLPSTALVLSDSTVAPLLDVIHEFGLDEDYGVYSVHEHLSYTNGQAPYEGFADATEAITTVVDYNTIESDSIPTVYSVDLSTAQLLPIEFISSSLVSTDAYSELTTAVSNGFIEAFGAVIKTLSTEDQEAAGIRLITDLEKSALADPSKVVLISVPANENIKVARLISISSMNTDVDPFVPTLFTYSPNEVHQPSGC